MFCFCIIVLLMNKQKEGLLLPKTRQLSKCLSPGLETSLSEILAGAGKSGVCLNT